MTTKIFNILEEYLSQIQEAIDCLQDDDEIYIAHLNKAIEIKAAISDLKGIDYLIRPRPILLQEYINTSKNYNVMQAGLLGCGK